MSYYRRYSFFIHRFSNAAKVVNKRIQRGFQPTKCPLRQQECKAISKAQAELRTALVEQPINSKVEHTAAQEAVQIHLSQETQAKIKEHQLFVLAALSESSKKLDPKFEAL